MNKQQGFTAVEAILILVIIAIIGFVGWRVFDTMQQTNQSLDQTAQVSDQTSQKPANAESKGQQKVVVADLGVQLTVPDELKNITFNAISEDAQGKTVGVSEESLNCDVHNQPLGLVSKLNGEFKQENTESGPNGRGGLVRQFDGFYITYISPQSICTQDKAMQDQAEKLHSAFMQAIKSVELAQ